MHRQNFCKEVEMYARVAAWEGAEAETMKQTAADIRAQAEAEGGPPEGLPAKGFLLLNDLEGGRTLGITLFETEEDYDQGNRKLEEMSSPGEGMGRRVSVVKYAVGVQVEA
jgi:hypothetical protein